MSEATGGIFTTFGVVTAWVMSIVIAVAFAEVVDFFQERTKRKRRGRTKRQRRDKRGRFR